MKSWAAPPPEWILNKAVRAHLMLLIDVLTARASPMALPPSAPSSLSFYCLSTVCLKVITCPAVYRFIGLSVFGSRSQAKDHSERTVRRCARLA